MVGRIPGRRCRRVALRARARFLGGQTVKRPRHKFGAERTEANGREYASKAEARYAQGLALHQQSGQLLFWLEQVPIALPGKTKYVVDFVEFWSDGDVKFVDVKGVETQLFRLKKRQVEEIYPFEIEVVNTAGRKRRKVSDV